MRKNILAVLILTIVCAVAVSGCLEWLFPPSQKDTPKVEAGKSLVGDTYQITIQSISNPTTVRAVKYVVKDPMGNDVRYGNLDEIYSKDIDGVMFSDSQGDGAVSLGDVFFIKSDSASGPGEGSGKFVLIYTVTAQKMLDVNL